MVRPPRLPRKAISHDEAWSKIVNANNEMSQPMQGNRSTPSNPPTSKPTARKKLIFNTRLSEVRQRCDPDGDHAECLVRNALSQSIVVDMNRKEWSSFLDILENEIRGLVLSSNSTFTYDNASLKGIETVFSKQFCEIIRKQSLRADGRGVQTAAVTMIFPRWNEGSCTLRINLFRGVIELAKALFGTTITRTIQAYYSSVGDDSSLTVPLIEFTLIDAK